VRSRLKLKLVLACSPYVSVVAAVSAAMVCTNAGGTPAATVKTRDRGLRFLDQNRRSVSEKTSLQDQFSERKCAGWSGVEKQRRNDSRRMHNERARRNEKIRVAGFRVISCPIFCFCKNDSAQDFAALHLR